MFGSPGFLFGGMTISSKHLYLARSIYLVFYRALYYNSAAVYTFGGTSPSTPISSSKFRGDGDLSFGFGFTFFEYRALGGAKSFSLFDEDLDRRRSLLILLVVLRRCLDDPLRLRLLLRATDLRLD